MRVRMFRKLLVSLPVATFICSYASEINLKEDGAASKTVMRREPKRKQTYNVTQMSSNGSIKLALDVNSQGADGSLRSPQDLHTKLHRVQNTSDTMESDNIGEDGAPGKTKMRREPKRPIEVGSKQTYNVTQISSDDSIDLALDVNFQGADGSLQSPENLHTKLHRVQDASDTMESSKEGSHGLSQHMAGRGAASKQSVFESASMFSSTLRWLLFALVVMGLTLAALCICHKRTEEANETEVIQQAQPRVEDQISGSPEGLDKDVYGMNIAVIIRDSRHLSMQTAISARRRARATWSVLVLIVTISLQLLILYESKHLVTSQSTNEAGLRTIDHGYRRGAKFDSNIANFAKMGDVLKAAAYQIPLSQPVHVVGIILLWTLLCTAEMRRALELGAFILMRTPTISTMSESCRESPWLRYRHRSCKCISCRVEGLDEAVLVGGLTYEVKALIAIIILIPRFLVSCVLLWLGCRSLCRTMSFLEIMQHVVALGFSLMLKNVFYTIMAPHRNKLETTSTMILPYARKQNPRAGPLFWGTLSIIWVILYVEVLQQALPEYT